MPRATKRQTKGPTPSKAAKATLASAKPAKSTPKKKPASNPPKKGRAMYTNHWRIDGSKDKAWHDRFLDEYSKNLNIRRSAAKVGVSRATVYAHMDEFEDFAEDVENARMALVEDLESVAFKTALKGDTGMIRFLLTHNMPDRYQRPKAVLIITPETLASLNEDELRLLESGTDPASVIPTRKK